MLFKPETPFNQDVQSVMLSFESMTKANLLEGDIVMVMIEGNEKLKTLAQVEVDPLDRITDVQVCLGEGVQVNLGILKKKYEIIKMIYINPDKWMSEAFAITLEPVSIKSISQKRKPVYRDAVKRFFRGKCRPVSLH